MTIERTISIIKPDAVAKNVIGQIYARFEASGLKVVAARMAHLSRGEAEAFYGVHKARPFFKDLVDFMISGPVMIQALEGENAILKNRDLMGATDPKKAAPGTIRADQMNDSEQYLRRLEFQLYVTLQLTYRILPKIQYVDLHCDNQQRHNRHQLAQMDRTG